VRVWRESNFADRMYLSYFTGGAILILLLRHRVPGWRVFVELHVIMIAVVLSLVLGARRFKTAHAWYPLVIPLVTFPEIAQLNFLFVTGWRDQFLLDLEARLFPEPPTVALSRIGSPVITEILQIGYLSYFFHLVIVAAVLYRRTDKAPFFGVIAASVLGYMLCYAIYVTFPTEGPAHTLRHLHTTPLTGGAFHWMVNLAQRAGVHGNAFPSAHVVGAMVPLVFAWRYAPRLAVWLTPLVMLLCIGAVYDRYHYVSDVVAGIPLGAAAASFVMLAQARPRWARWLNIAG
jgi:membrane-associated phospholipid phosphatase